MRRAIRLVSDLPTVTTEEIEIPDELQLLLDAAFEAGRAHERQLMQQQNPWHTVIYGNVTDFATHVPEGGPDFAPLAPIAPQETTFTVSFIIPAKEPVILPVPKFPDYIRPENCGGIIPTYYVGDILLQRGSRSLGGMGA